ncbi:MAG: M20 family metallopeptidase, partial [Actinomycetota bacterium]
MDDLEQLRARTDSMVEHLRAVVEAESPSKDLEATARCAKTIAGIGEELLGAAPELVTVDGRGHLLWRFGERTRVLLIGHMDTVWPAGTIARWPFHLDGDRATGPGAFDMKSGIVQTLHALATLADRDGVTMLLTSDEEIGSPSSSALIVELASGAEAALVLEPAEGGALKTGRKGVTMYTIEIGGRAAHAGLEPERGANALVEAAHQILALVAMADADAGTTMTPTIAHSGTATNVVPATARIEVDVRALTIAEQDRVHEQMQRLTPRVDGTTIRVDGVPNRPPMEISSSADLFARAAAIAERLGIGPLRGVTVGGASDGNFTAAAGCPTLDGLGGVGAGAHAEGEHVLISEMAPRAALLASLIEELLDGGA